MSLWTVVWCVYSEVRVGDYSLLTNIEWVICTQINHEFQHILPQFCRFYSFALKSVSYNKTDISHTKITWIGVLYDVYFSDWKDIRNSYNRRGIVGTSLLFLFVVINCNHFTQLTIIWSELRFHWNTSTLMWRLENNPLITDWLLICLQIWRVCSEETKNSFIETNEWIYCMQTKRQLIWMKSNDNPI